METLRFLMHISGCVFFWGCFQRWLACRTSSYKEIYPECMWPHPIDWRLQRKTNRKRKGQIVKVTSTAPSWSMHSSYHLLHYSTRSHTSTPQRTLQSFPFDLPLFLDWAANDLFGSCLEQTSILGLCSLQFCKLNLINLLL